MNKLIIPKSKQIKSLYVFCNRCKIKSKTKLKSTDKCNHPAESQKYKVLITIPGTKKMRTRNLKTRNIDDAIIETLNFASQLEKNGFSRIEKENCVEVLPQDLIGCFGMYIDFLENKNVPAHQIKLRSSALIKQNVRYVKRFVSALKEAKIDVKNMRVSSINQNHVGIFCAYIINKYNPANRTYNRHMDTMSEFFSYLIHSKEYVLTNQFSTKLVNRRTTVSRIQAIKIQKFQEMQGVINKENGVQILSTGERKHHYAEWLSQAFTLGLLTGARRDELMDMKFSDVYEENGKPIYIKKEDFKYNRSNNLTREEEKKYKYFPVFKDLLMFLNDEEYSKYKGSDRYIIAPNSKRNRNTLKENMSKAFSHFYKIVDPENPLQFKCLRKTYITLLNNFTGDEAHLLTGHSGQEIIMNNYHDQTVFNNAVMNFSLLN